MELRFISKILHLVLYLLLVIGLKFVSELPTSQFEKQSIIS